jgi:hypothetical protein
LGIQAGSYPYLCPLHILPVVVESSYAERFSVRVTCFGGLMTTVTILHLSDLHYSISEANNISIIKKALADDLERLSRRSIIPDIVIFSGDLVLAGENAEMFATVDQNFLQPILYTLKLGNDA